MEGGLTLDPWYFSFAVRTRNSRNSQKIISLFWLFGCSCSALERWPKR